MSEDIVTAIARKHALHISDRNRAPEGTRSPEAWERGYEACALQVDAALREALEELEQRSTAAMRNLLSRPHVGAWLDEVLVEAAHQVDRWGSEHDAGKEPHDWYWLIGYLAGKALRAHQQGDVEKARHHTVSTAAVLANWAAQISGAESVMRPGIGPEALARAALESEATT